MSNLLWGWKQITPKKSVYVRLDLLPHALPPGYYLMSNSHIGTYAVVDHVHVLTLCVDPERPGGVRHRVPVNERSRLYGELLIVHLNSGGMLSTFDNDRARHIYGAVALTQFYKNMRDYLCPECALDGFQCLCVKQHIEGGMFYSSRVALPGQVVGERQELPPNYDESQQ